MLPSYDFPGNYVFYVAFCAAVAFFIYSVSVKVAVFARGKPDWRFDHLFERLASLGPYLVGNSRVVRPRYWYSGVLHTMIYWGFIVLQIRTLNFLLKGVNNDISLEHLGGTYYDVLVRAPMDLFNILVVVGCAMAAYQRAFWKPARLTLNRDAWLILFLISFLMVTDVFVNSFEIATDPHGGQAWSFLAYGLAQVWNNIGMSQGTKEGFLDFWWYAHLADFLVFLNYLPYSKHSHLLTVPFNILFRRVEPTGKLQPIRDFETAERFGAGVVNDLSWKQMLDPYTCTECGRCEINCPAYLTGKELSPKKIMHDMRTAIEQEVRKIQSPLFVWDALREASDETPVTNGNGHGDVKELTLIDAVGFNPVWDCVTCGACQYQCPVFIEHVPALQDMRRFLTMNEANMPETAAATLMQGDDPSAPFRSRFQRMWMNWLDHRLTHYAEVVFMEQYYNSPWYSFWCCTGTGAEEFSKFADTIYFHDQRGVFVNLFIASELSWPEKGLKLRQETNFPEQEGTTLVVHSQRPVELALRVRIPYWATRGGTVKLNGSPLPVFSSPSSYLTLNRVWKDGDRVDLSLPMSLHLDPIPDDPTLQAVMYGPLVLAGQLGGQGLSAAVTYPGYDTAPTGEPLPVLALATASKEPAAWVEPAPGSQNVNLVPLYRLSGERYAVYWKVSTKAV